MKRYNITVNGTAYDVMVEENKTGAPVAAHTPVAPAPSAAPPSPVGAPRTAAPPAPAPAPAPAEPAPAAPVASNVGGTPIIAPMPGNVLDIKAVSGQTVKSGEVLVILEAMKMENEIVSPKDGTVTEILVNKGDTVDVGATFMYIA